MSKTSQFPTLRTIGLTIVAMLAFAANSVFCRLALMPVSIDPASFTLIRIVSGVAALWCILAFTGKAHAVRGSWLAALALFVYAAAFSFAYITLSAAVGALLLFGAVQVTMVTTGLARGDRLTPTQWFGFIVALVGLFVFLIPGVTAPPIGGVCLMVTAGIAWGIYSLLGSGSADPLAATAGNFLRALPIAAILLTTTASLETTFRATGAIYAVLSGALTSGLGYSIWYAALPGLSSVQSASVQLSVPVLAALAGALVLGEAVTTCFYLCLITIVGGIALVIASRSQVQNLH